MERADLEARVFKINEQGLFTIWIDMMTTEKNNMTGFSHNTFYSWVTSIGE